MFGVKKQTQKHTYGKKNTTMCNGIGGANMHTKTTIFKKRRLSFFDAVTIKNGQKIPQELSNWQKIWKDFH